MAVARFFTARPVQRFIIPRTSGIGIYHGRTLQGELPHEQEEADKIATLLLSGRAAERWLDFPFITTGVQRHIEQATKIACSMVTRSGMNEFDMRWPWKTVNNQYLGEHTSLICELPTMHKNA